MRVSVRLDSTTTEEIRQFLAQASPLRQNLDQYPRAKVEGPNHWGAETDPISPLAALNMIAAAHAIKADEPMASGNAAPIYLALRPKAAQNMRAELFRVRDQFRMELEKTAGDLRHVLERLGGSEDDFPTGTGSRFGALLSQLSDLIANLPEVDD